MAMLEVLCVMTRQIVWKGNRCEYGRDLLCNGWKKMGSKFVGVEREGEVISVVCDNVASRVMTPENCCEKLCPLFTRRRMLCNLVMSVGGVCSRQALLWCLCVCEIVSE